MRFASKVAELRRQRKWSQEKLAQKINVSREVVADWESGAKFPTKDQMELLAAALKTHVKTLVAEDEELMLQVIEGTEKRETTVMAVLSVVTLASAGVLVTLSSSGSPYTQVAIRVAEVVLLVAFVAIMVLRRGPAAMRARAFRDALEEAAGSEVSFLTKRAGRSTRVVVMQFVLAAVIALTLIAVLGVMMPESNLPWVRLI